MSNLSPFKVMTSILNNTQPTEKEILTLNSFFCCRWLSNNRFTVQMGNEINKNYDIPINIQYKFYTDVVELSNMKKHVSFIKYSKDKQNKEFQKLMDNIQRKYKVNETVAQDYFNLMDNEEKNRIYNMYNEGIQ